MVENGVVSVGEVTLELGLVDAVVDPAPDALPVGSTVDEFGVMALLDVEAPVVSVVALPEGLRMPVLPEEPGVMALLDVETLVVFTVASPAVFVVPVELVPV